MNQGDHFQADRIEQVLSSHRRPSCVTGGTVPPRLVWFQVAALSEESALSLGARSCRVCGAARPAG